MVIASVYNLKPYLEIPLDLKDAIVCFLESGKYHAFVECNWLSSGRETCSYRREKHGLGRAERDPRRQHVGSQGRGSGQEHIPRAGSSQPMLQFGFRTVVMF